jgi:hypothetical protein
MTTDLQRLDETPLDTLVQISDDVEGYVRAAKREDQEMALARLDRGLITRLFPTRDERERQRLEVDNMRALAEAKLRMVEYYTDLQLVIARQRGDALVAAHGTHLQAMLAAFAAQKHAELSKTLNASRRTFMDEIGPELEYVERYRSRPELYEPAHASVQHQIDTYFSTLKTLLDGYVYALETKVRKQLEG